MSREQDELDEEIVQMKRMLADLQKTHAYLLKDTEKNSVTLTSLQKDRDKVRLELKASLAFKARHRSKELPYITAAEEANRLTFFECEKNAKADDLVEWKAKVRSDYDRIFSVRVITKVGSNKIEEVVTEFSAEEGDDLIEIKTPLKLLTAHKDVQNFFRAVVTFDTLHSFRKQEIKKLQDSIYARYFNVHAAVPGPDDEHSENLSGYTIVAFNPNTVENYFELLWSISWKENYHSLVHNFTILSLPDAECHTQNFFHWLKELMERDFTELDHSPLRNTLLQLTNSVKDASRY